LERQFENHVAKIIIDTNIISLPIIVSKDTTVLYTIKPGDIKNITSDVIDKNGLTPIVNDSYPATIDIYTIYGIID
jgi:hypothetical protein